MLQITAKKLLEESPAEEMQRLLRTIAGHKRPDENNKSMLSRVYRRLQLNDLTHRTLESYWRGAVRDVPSHHMDRCRELAFVQPIQEAEIAIERVIAHYEELRTTLRTKLEASTAILVHRPGAGDPVDVPGGSPPREVGSRSAAPRLDKALTVARHLS